jgi:hypothetical protein
VKISNECGFEYPPVRTENISSSGFYCIVQSRFSIGDRLDCRIQIPVQRFSLSPSELWLNCKAIVVRVERTDAGIGLGCEFENFRVAAS